jgi:hypothetical protein
MAPHTPVSRPTPLARPWRRPAPNTVPDLAQARRRAPIKGRSAVRRRLGRTAITITISRLSRRRRPEKRRSRRRLFPACNGIAKRTISLRLKTTLLKVRRQGVR